MYHGERFNGYSHLCGVLLAIAGAAVLITLGAMQGDAWKVVSFSIYGATLITLYSSSTLYHSMRGRAKDVFRKLDHSAIYLLIAGTYTPFTLVTLGGGWGWSLFGVVWGLAVFGIVQELALKSKKRMLSLYLYIGMGWVAVIGVIPLIEALTWAGFAWVVAGGVVYTVGTIFYFYDERFKHWHGIWHLFVLGGSALHYVAIFNYVA
ncbi:MAG: hemolysin III family protein [Betaproteobacteria bacterium]|nr:hemolysin III family protein [Betaproteobacteria bacterium]